ncbi:MAG: hypothetical protein NZ699_17195 [Roseiflexus sp.]|nr:hypothetical protein [Roseiflexus sp.]MCS7290859.1 hypothetical protein [Roseiflexus sp.]MDW8234072.1 hypothetical protein [Roseiflexaceae bacterium]
MPHRAPYKVALQALQSDRLRRDYADLAAEPQYRLVGEFFFTELYGPRDFSARDAQARRLHLLVQSFPGVVIRDVEQVLELLDLTNRLDDEVVEQLIAMGAPLDFDMETYERAYRLADNYADRVRQIELVRQSLYNVARLTRNPLLGIALDRTKGLADMLGMSDIHRFLRLGYKAVLPVRDMPRFIETITVREMNRLDRIYADQLKQKKK